MKRSLIKRKPLRLKKPKRHKKGETRKLKEQLEALQKQVVIKRYGRDCYTCPAKNLEGKNCQLGHVPWPRSILSTECKFDYRFTRIQCMVDNVHRGGMGAKALERMQKEGIDTDSMWSRNEETKGKTYNNEWLRGKIAEYQTLLNE